MATATTMPTTDEALWDMEVKKDSGSGDYVACPPGNFPATIVGLFDVGHQPETNDKGANIEVRKLVLVFELAKKRPDGKPFILCQRYTWSMKDNSNFYKLASNVTGIKFVDGAKFNPLPLVGLPVMVSVTNTTSGDKTYHNVGSVAGFPEGFPAPEPTLTPVRWTVLADAPFPDGLTWLPYVYGKSIKSLAEDSSEARKKAGYAAPGQGAVPQPTAQAAPSGEDPDCPF